MARWSLEFSPDAERDLARLDGAVRRRVIEKLDWFLANFDALFQVPLTGDFREFYCRASERNEKHRLFFSERAKATKVNTAWLAAHLYE